MQTGRVIETVGETVESDASEDVPLKSDVSPKDIPIYTVARAVDWMKRPENEQRIRKIAEVAGQAQRQVAQQIDREVTKVWRLLVDIGTNDEIAEDFTNSFLKSLIDD